MESQWILRLLLGALCVLSSASVPLPVDPTPQLVTTATTTTTESIRSTAAIETDPSGTDSVSQPGSHWTDQLVTDGVYWSPQALANVPTGYDDQHTADWQRYLQNARIRALASGCGRMQNRRVQLEAADSPADNQTSCFRYRRNLDQMQGELFSHQLGRLLGIRNLPPTAAVPLDRLHYAHTDELRQQLRQSGWARNELAIATRFVPNLTEAGIPEAFHRLPTAGEPLLSRHRLPALLTGADRASAVAELVQWSDLILFDYLIANLDRVVNNLSNLKWNPQMMQAPAHNLYRRADGLLVFLDQESGLLHGYRLLHKYERLHLKLLRSLCVFNADTVRRLRPLASVHTLRRMLRAGDAQLDALMPFLPDASLATLASRAGKVLRQVQHCEKLAS